MRHQLGQLVFVGVADDLGYAGQGCNFLGRALRITTGHNYFAIRIFPMDAANGRPCVLVRGRSHGAGVQHHQFGGRCQVGTLQPLGAELLLNGRAIRLGGAAAEIFHVEAGHTSIVPEAMTGV